MDCSKTWGLMMSKMDGSIKDQDSDMLEDHVALCSNCKEQWERLKAAASELESKPAKAPENIERCVMARLCFIRQKEKVGMLPYVISPAAILSGLLALLMFNSYKAGPISMAGETARTLSFLMKVLQAIAAVVQYIFKIPYMREALIILLVFILVGIAAFVYRNVKKINDTGVYWRASR